MHHKIVSLQGFIVHTQAVRHFIQLLGSAIVEWRANLTEIILGQAVSLIGCWWTLYLDS